MVDFVHGDRGSRGAPFPPSTACPRAASGDAAPGARGHRRAGAAAGSSSTARVAGAHVVRQPGACPAWAATPRTCAGTARRPGATTAYDFHVGRPSAAPTCSPTVGGADSHAERGPVVGIGHSCSAAAGPRGIRPPRHLRGAVATNRPTPPPRPAAVPTNPLAALALARRRATFADRARSRRATTRRSRR
ncbi:hypothetical protein ACU686_37000 [Yinghuangia aomiensis]